MNEQITRQTKQLTTLLITQGMAAVAHAQATNQLPATVTAKGTNAPTKLPDVLVTGERESYKTDSVKLPKITQPLRDTAQSILEPGKSNIRQFIRLDFWAEAFVWCRRGQRG